MSEERKNTTGAIEAIKAEAAKVLEKMQALLDKTDVDEKIVEAAKGLKEKAQELLDKTDVDEKIVEGAKNLFGKIGSIFGGKDKE